MAPKEERKSVLEKACGIWAYDFIRENSAPHPLLPPEGSSLVNISEMI